jgi:hypothetical protein
MIMKHKWRTWIEQGTQEARGSICVVPLPLHVLSVPCVDVTRIRAKYPHLPGVGIAASFSQFSILFACYMTSYQTFLLALQFSHTPTPSTDFTYIFTF